MNTKLLCAIAFSVLLLAADGRADIIFFDLTGNGGEGLLESNVTPATGEPGTGGAGVAGIFFDTTTSTIHFDLEWGSGNGYTDLSADVVKLHLHGPTSSNSPGSFSETGPILINMSTSLNFDPSATSGSLVDEYFLSNTEAGYLMAGRTYINVHLSDTDTGMLRGYLVQQVPEPGSMGAIGTLAMLSLLGRRRRKK